MMVTDRKHITGGGLVMQLMILYTVIVSPESKLYSTTKSHGILLSIQKVTKKLSNGSFFSLP